MSKKSLSLVATSRSGLRVTPQGVAIDVQDLKDAANFIRQAPPVSKVLFAGGAALIGAAIWSTKK